MNALVIGANGFGKHHARILAQSPLVRNLTLTATSEKSAQQAEDELLKKVRRRDLTVSKYGVSTPEQIEGIAQVERPDLTCICSPDEYHVQAINAVAPYSKRILCEKPIGPVSDAPVMDHLNIDPQQLAIELPMYAFMPHLIEHEKGDYIREAPRLYVHWTLDAKEKPIIDNIVPHAWSILARMGTVIPRKAKLEGSMLEIEGVLDQITGSKTFIMQTGYEKNPKRALHTPQTAFGFQRIERIEKVIHQGQEIMGIGNPLGDNIYAALKGEPIAGYDVARACQIFNEDVYKLLR